MSVDGHEKAGPNPLKSIGLDSVKSKVIAYGKNIRHCLSSRNPLDSLGRYSKATTNPGTAKCTYRIIGFRTRQN